MPVSRIEDLSPEARHSVRQYLDEVGAALCQVDGDLARETLDDLSAHLLSSLGPASTSAEVADVVAVLGAPDEYGAALCDALSLDDAGTERGSGTLLGMPYDLRVPTAQRIASRWWSPADQRVFMPRVFGLGWDLNFGALAVKLHLIEPDAEDEPFAHAPDSAFGRALYVPVLLTLAICAAYAALRSQLPASLPAHWDITGTADQFWPASTAFLLVVAIAGVPTAWACWAVATRRPPIVRGGAIALAALLSAVAAGVWTLTLVTALGAPALWWLPPAFILPALAVPMAVLVSLARAGRNAEIRRDLADPDLEGDIR